MRQLKGMGGGVLAMVFLLTGHLAFANERLFEAVREGDIATLKSLLNGKADVNFARPDGSTALAWAVYSDYPKAVELLIRAGADVNTANIYGVTPLSLACANGNATVVETLLVAKADPNRAKQTGETPLMRCANNGAIEAVKALIEAGAEVNAKENVRGQTALMWAAEEQHPAVVRELVSHGADVHARSRMVPEPEPYVNDVPGVESIFASNFPPTVRFAEISGGFTALHFAARQGDEETARILLEAGADVNAPHLEHGSALVIAIASGHEELALYLLKNGADPNIKDAWGIAPLHYALHKGVLILNNYSPADTDSQLGWARPNMPRLVAALVDYGADPNARIKFSYPYLDNLFLSRTMEDPPQVDPVGATPLMVAAASGDVESMRILEEVSDVSATTIGGATVLMLAAGVGAERGVRSEEEALEAAKFALAIGGGNVNDHLTERAPGGGEVYKGTEDGRTMLHYAADLGWLEMIRFLAEHGADLNPKDRHGVTPMMLALGDPEQRYHRPLYGNEYDFRFRRSDNPMTGIKGVADLLLELGAAPFTGKYADRRGR